MKCDKCDYDDLGTGDTAHVCGPIQLKTPVQSVRTIYQLQNKVLHLIAEKQKQSAELDANLRLSSMNESIGLLSEKKQLLKSMADLTELLHDIFWLIAEKPATSWEGQVDRQGGSFTAEEMDPNRGWR